MEPKRERHPPPSLLASALVSLRVPLTAKEKKSILTNSVDSNHLNLQSKRSFLAVLGIEPRLKRAQHEISVKKDHNVTCYHYWKQMSACVLK
jgi:hypothetical protein